MSDSTRHPHKPICDPVLEGMEYACSGGWIAVAWTFIRWLRANSCSDFAYILEREVQSLPTFPMLHVETATLAAVRSSLAPLYNDPPKHLTHEQIKVLVRLRHRVGGFVQFRLRELASERERTRRAARNLGVRLTAHAAADSTGAATCSEPEAEIVRDDHVDNGGHYSISLVAEIWSFRYGTDRGQFPKHGNQCIEWLVKLLAAPNRSLSVADLRGDPEGKLAADAMLRNERETDREGMTAARNRLDEIEQITADTGGSEALEEEKAQLLAQVKQYHGARTAESALKREHANIATQLRSFRKKLATPMPQLAAHLKASVKLEFPEFGYYPPNPSPPWQF